MAVDEIVRRHSFSSWRKKFQSDMSDGVLGGEKVLVLKPQTYMNESGALLVMLCGFTTFHCPMSMCSMMSWI